MAAAVCSADCPKEAGVPASAEYDAEATWLVLAEVAREALARSGAERVLGIAAAGMRHGGAVLDADGHEVFVASNRAARGAFYNSMLSQSLGRLEQAIAATESGAPVAAANSSSVVALEAFSCTLARSQDSSGANSPSAM